MEIATTVILPMLNNHPTQMSRNGFSQPSYSPNGQQPLGGVRQDKRARDRARRASMQPASLKNEMRAHRMNRNPSRSQNRLTANRRTVQVTLWVKPVVKAELQRTAENEGVSVSATGGAFLERALQANIDMHYSALLQPIIEQAIRTQMRSYSSRIAVLLVRSLFTSEQTRGLATNILGRQPGITPEVLKNILDGSSNTAKGNITRITPQLEELIDAVEQWMVTEEGETHTHE